MLFQISYLLCSASLLMAGHHLANHMPKCMDLSIFHRALARERLRGRWAWGPALLGILEGFVGFRFALPNLHLGKGLLFRLNRFYSAEASVPLTPTIRKDLTGTLPQFLLQLGQLW